MDWQIEIEYQGIRNAAHGTIAQTAADADEAERNLTRGLQAKGVTARVVAIEAAELI